MNPLLLALVVLVVLLAGSAIGRHFTAPGWPRNTLSVAMVVLALLAMFVFFFGAGTFMKGLRAQAERQSRAPSSSSLVFVARADAP